MCITDYLLLIILITIVFIVSYNLKDVCLLLFVLTPVPLPQASCISSFTNVQIEPDQLPVITCMPWIYFVLEKEVQAEQSIEHEIISTKPSSIMPENSEIYRMNSSPRGIAVIINNKTFLLCSGQHLSPRQGTDVDRDALKKLFQKLQFKVEIYNNITKAEIRNIAEKKASSDHSNYDAFIFTILTHGEEGLVYGTDGTISIRDITSKFKSNPSLAGKPKIFFFQACQGKKINNMDQNSCAHSKHAGNSPEIMFMFTFLLTLLIFSTDRVKHV